METLKLGLVESYFADLVWQNAPIATKELITICEKELNWKRTTTYTVLKKLCLRGLFDMTNARVTVLMTKEEFKAISSQQFVEKTFGGSLPAFIAAFTSRKNLSRQELNEIRAMIDSYEG